MKENGNKILLACLLVGSLTVGGTASVAMAKGNAYENFKSAVSKTMDEENRTVSTNFTISNNDEVLVSGNQIAQMDGDFYYSSGELTSGNTTAFIESAENDTEFVTGVDGNYERIVFDNNFADEWDEDTEMPNRDRLTEMVSDILIGDVKMHFTGDSNNVSVNLEEAQIPELLNVALSAVNEQGQRNTDRDRDREDEMTYKMFEDVKIPQLKNLKVKSFSMDSALENGVVTQIDALVVLTGEGSDGTDQEIKLQMQSELYDLGSTVPSTIDLAGKTVNEVDVTDR